MSGGGGRLVSKEGSLILIIFAGLLFGGAGWSIWKIFTAHASLGAWGIVGVCSLGVFLIFLAVVLLILRKI